MLQLYSEYSPLISVITTTYNRASMIERCIESVLAQTFKSWELIIVDDGSQDDTYKIISGYMCNYENIRFAGHSNRGLPLSRNMGIKASVGKYITFLDSDDEYKANHLELRAEFMHNHQGVDLIHGGIEIIGSPFVVNKNDSSQLIHLDNCVIGATFFAKRTVFFELRGFKNIAYSEDSEFYERALGHFNIVKVKFPTYIYHRDTPNSICNLKQESKMK